MEHEHVLNLTNEDGFRITSSRAEPLPEEKLVDFSGQKYTTARDLVGASGGRILDWKLLEHLQSARERNWPMVKVREHVGGTVAVCGSGPSMGNHEILRELRTVQRKGGKVHAINRCHDFLLTKGIKPDSASLLDPIPHVADYIKPRKDVEYFIGFQCHPDTFDVFDKADIQKYIWYCRTSALIDSQLTPQELAYAVPSRTSTNGLRSVMLGYMRGFREFHFFGFDSCYETYVNDKGVQQIALSPDGKGKLHAHAKPETVHDVKSTKIVQQSADGNRVVYEKDYFTNSAMLAQADEFTILVDDLRQGIIGGFMDDISIIVHGDGLIPDIACSPRYPLHFNRKRIRPNG